MKTARNCLVLAILILSGCVGTVGQWQKAADIKKTQEINKEENHTSKKICDKKSATEKDKIFEKQKYIVLTFDDGPHSIYTPKILDLLEYYNVRATFFVVGQRITGHEAILRRMIKNGNEIGNHTWSHPKLIRLSSKKIQKEVSDSQQIIMKSTGYKAKLFRPPYGAYNASTKRVVGMPFILWTIDTLDWKNQKTDIIVQRIMRKAGKGSIILMHDIHAPALEIMKIIIPQLKKDGFVFITASELEKL